MPSATGWQGYRTLPRLERLGLVVDVLMVILVIANLALLLFDWLFSSTWVRLQIRALDPAFHDWYRDTLHADFIAYDLFFVGIYVTELLVRWGIAIVRRTHHRWFFYPFVHWYDVLGCIPVGSFRWLRVLRLVSLALRLQRLGVLNLEQTWLGRSVLKYYRILVEEIADRVVINVLSGVQKEIRRGSPLLHRIEHQVLAPRKAALVDELAERLVHASQAVHQSYRRDLAEYLSRLTDESLARTRSGARLAAIPVAGPRALALMGDVVQELGTALVDQLVQDLADPRHRERLDQLLSDLLQHVTTGTRGDMDQLIRETLDEILEQVKMQVAVQSWKQDPDDCEPDARRPDGTPL